MTSASVTIPISSFIVEDWFNGLWHTFAHYWAININVCNVQVCTLLPCLAPYGLLVSC